MTPEKYRDRLKRAAYQLLDCNGGKDLVSVKGDLEFMEAVDAVLDEIRDRFCGAENPANPSDRCDRAAHSKKTRHLWELTDLLDALATLDRPRPQPRKRQKET